MGQEIAEYLEELARTEFYDEEQEFSLWPNASFEYDALCCTCTAGANMVARKFGGKVFGYEFDDMILESEFIANSCGGHDFAIVNDFLVDYWAHYVEDQKNRPILHLINDAEIIKSRYLPRHEWVELPLWLTK